MSMDAKSIEGISFTGENSTVPPGFRFHPTDEELVGYYLTKKVASNKIDLDVIREIDLYKLEPWDLQERCRIGSAEQHEWYFFSHKDKKYPTGTRTNRATTAGFWKATGRDKPIFARVKLIGMRKTLVFYKGRAPNGQKSDWIMHEYRLEDDINNTTANEEGWVVCRVFKKRSIVKKPSSDFDATCCYDEELGTENSKLSTSTLTSSQQFNVQSSTTNTPNDSTNNNNHSSQQQQQGLLVKQELENPFYFPFPYDAFAQLPRLESPKRSCENPSTTTTTTTSCSMGNNLVEEQNNNQMLTTTCSSRPSGSRGMHMDYALEELVQLGANKSSCGFLQQQQQADHFHAFQEDLPPASWGMDDRLLTELSQDEYPKDMRFPMTGNLVAELPQRSSSKRGHMLQQQQDQLLQMPDYSYDVDLWSFNR